MRLGRSFALLVAVLCACSAAHAQYFGRNKVQWEHFKFRVLRTEHFDVYYYPSEERAVQDAARMAERWYARLSRVFDHELSARKPLVLYASHPDFQQTTVTSGLIGEGTGGFTEALRTRVVLPLTDVYADTDHVLGHELVHAFQYDLAAVDTPAGLGGVAVPELPLWIVEGLAEYLSQGWDDPQTAMWLRDALAHDYLPKFETIDRDPRLSPYQYGQAFWAFVAGHWDERTAIALYRSANRSDLVSAFHAVLGLTPQAVFDAWRAAIQKDYQPVLDVRQDPPEAARPLLGRENTGARLNVAPALSPDGKRIAFLSTRDLFSVDLYVADATTGKVQRKLVSADADPHFSALRFIDSAGAWSPEGRLFAFVVTSRGDQAIVVVDTETRNVKERLRFPEIEAIANPTWSPAGDRLAFSGSSGGFSDLYVVNLKTRAVERLTNDPLADLQPAWSPDGKRIAFVSDRGRGDEGTDLERLEYGQLGLWLLDLADKSLHPVEAFAGAKHINPQFGPDGDLYFVANPEGISDLFRLDAESGQVVRLTALRSGVTGITETSPAISVASASGDIAFSTLQGGEWGIYELSGKTLAPGLPRETGAANASVLPPAEGGANELLGYIERPDPAPPLAAPQTSHYRPKLHLDYVGPMAIGVSADNYGLGYGGGISGVFGDMLNRHRLALAIAAGGSSEFDVTQTVAAQASYLNQSHRMHWGGTLSRVPYLSGFTFARAVPVDVNGTTVQGTEIGRVIEVATRQDVSGVASYPLSLTKRIETSAGLANIDFDSQIDSTVFVGNTAVAVGSTTVPPREPLDLVWGSMAFVGDSSHFGFASPLRGTRYRLELSQTGGDLNYETGLIDYRRYAFARPVTFAFRGLHLGRYGADAEDERLSELFVGHNTLVRGYDVGSFSASECTPVLGNTGCPEFDRLVGSRLAVLNFELRLPLVGNEDFGFFNLGALPMELALFADAGAAWSDEQSLDLRFARDTIDRVPVSSAGVALRVVLGFFPIQLYYALPFQRPEEGGTFGFVIAPGW
jgi:WD40 repeat protein